MDADTGAVADATPGTWWGSSPENRAAAEAADKIAKLEALRMISRRCLQPDAKGRDCQNLMTQWFEGAGWRCRFHMPEGEAWPHRVTAPRPEGYTGVGRPPNPDVPMPPADPPPNDGRIESVEDANALIGWATQQLALGRIPESRCRGVINGANRYIRNINEIEGKERMDKMEKGMRDAGLLK